MKNLLRILLVSGLLLLLLSAVASADSGSPVLKAMATSSERTTLVWDFAAGDTLLFSLDGITWNEIPRGETGVRITEPPDGNNVLLGLTDYTNYYFRARHSDGSVSTTADAFPPDEHAHKYFAADTNMCAGCHATHAATGASLTKESSIQNVCKTCHAGTGSKYQVDTGMVKNGTGATPSLGGPFGKQLNPSTTVTPTSSHMLGSTLTTAPGGDPTNRNGEWNVQLSCASCHTAHSSGGYQYRLLRSQMPNMQVSGGGTASRIIVEAYAVSTNTGEYGVYVSGMNMLCGGCHADYNTTNVAKPGQNRSGVYRTDFYRHAVGNNVATYPMKTTLPLESIAPRFVSNGSEHSSGIIACMTCHKPHGVTTTAPGNGSTSLLIMNNRGVCQDCHKK